MPRADWLDSEVAPFIRRILKASTDQQRTSILLEMADWLEAHGDKHDNVKYFRNPHLYWEGSGPALSWRVDPWMNKPHGGRTCRIAWDQWAWFYPTESWLASPRAAELVRAWMKNHVDSAYGWEQEVVDRNGFGAAYRTYRADRDSLKEAMRRIREADEQRDRREYERLWDKYGGKPPKELT